MKFIRNTKIRDRIVDFVSKMILIAVSALVCLWMVSGARAGTSEITGIKAQALDNGGFAIDFSLSQKVDKEAVAVEFERNFIQLSLRGVSAYPARTESINTPLLEKVFTYQYQPDLARARVLLKSSAAAVRDKATWEVTSQGVRILLRGAESAQAATVSDLVKTKAAASTNNKASDPEDERIVKEILEEARNASGTPKSVAPAAPEKKVAPEDQPLFASAASGAADKLEARGKESTATKVFASLLLVIGVIGATAVAFRRFVLGKGGNPFQRQNRMIEVVASQGLGPKRSIAIVKVLDQTMVVGMAGDSMSLLANLGRDVNLEKFMDQSGPGASFSDTFEGALLGGVTPAKAAVPSAGPGTTQKSGMDLGIRASIKKRIEGFKPL